MGQTAAGGLGIIIQKIVQEIATSPAVLRRARMAARPACRCVEAAAELVNMLGEAESGASFEGSRFAAVGEAEEAAGKVAKRL